MDELSGSCDLPPTHVDAGGDRNVRAALPDPAGPPKHLHLRTLLAKLWGLHKAQLLNEFTQKPRCRRSPLPDERDAAKRRELVGVPFRHAKAEDKRRLVAARRQACSHCGGGKRRSAGGGVALGRMRAQ
ncbi:hypothetical protein NDU88_003274 [Pleurodeles waltl]|uniref:Uncharacterized protein n=1 Tax=Pleurodeles waltl TaxID=8319 RepID=A0AAV7MQ35_PLEWA|nr:hypothetical protein NDU88_003274 [Pleurodeles waltl]